MKLSLLAGSVLALLLTASVSDAMVSNGKPKNLTALSTGTTHSSGSISWLTTESVPEEELEMWVQAQAEHPEFKMTGGSRQLSAFLASGLNSDPDQNLKSLNKYFAQIDLIQSEKDIATAVGILHRIGIPVVFSMTPAGDDHNAIVLNPLPTPASEKLSPAAYLDYLDELSGMTMGTLIITPEVAKQIAAIDAAILSARNGEINGQTVVPDPFFNWNQFWTQLQFDPSRFTSEAPASLYNLTNRINSIADLDTWKVYLKWRLLEAMAPAIGGNVAMIHYQYLAPGERTPARWRQVLDVAGELSGEGMSGHLFPRLISKEDKSQIVYRIELAKGEVKNQIALRTDLDESEKNRLITTLDNLTIRVGSLPGTIAETDLSANGNDWMNNILRAGSCKTKHLLCTTHSPDQVQYDAFRNEGTLSRELVGDFLATGSYDSFEQTLTGMIGGWIGYEIL
ncbi:MAG: hypothetical protein HUU10_10155 [Bacteroidetes bacterium]|nr:hypothetical protein [Bacteroidota bacterium]